MNVSKYQLDSCCLLERVRDIHPEQKQMEKIQQHSHYGIDCNSLSLRNARLGPNESGKHARECP
jgi:hypothetical protein